MDYSASKAVARDSDGIKAFAMDYFGKAITMDIFGKALTMGIFGKALPMGIFARDSYGSKVLDAPDNGALKAPAMDDDGALKAHAIQCDKLGHQLQAGKPS